MDIWFWIVVNIVRIILFIPGMRRVRSERVIGPEEGIEDEAMVKAYDKASRMLPFMVLRKMVIRRLKKLSPHGVLVDIGCGPGYFTADIARAFPELEIIASDISQEMLGYARKNHSEAGLDRRFEYRQADIHELPFEDDSVDFMVSTFSMHHWDDPPKAFNEIYRVLKPGGGFLVFDTRRDSPWLVYKVIKLAQIFILPPPHREKNEPTSSVMASYTPREAQSFLQNTLFENTSVKGGLFWLYVSGRKPE